MDGAETGGASSPLPAVGQVMARVREPGGRARAGVIARAIALLLAAGLAGPALAPAEGADPPATEPGPRAEVPIGPVPCTPDSTPPDYYAFPLVPTHRVPGTADTEGRGEVHFGSSPYGISVTDDGSYLYQLRVTTGELPQRPDGTYVAWVTTRDLDEVERIGPVGPDGVVEGSVSWNKFLVVVTLEPTGAVEADDGSDPVSGDGQPVASGDAWAGPIVMRGMSRSGMMHTMAGHGPFQQENCAAYGYD